MRRNPSNVVISMVILISLVGAGCTLPVCTASEILVTRTDDVRGGMCAPEDCSLRQAILAANACSGTQTVVIPAGTYSLTRVGAGEDSSASGDLDITDSIRIVGNDMPVIDGNATDRIFDIQAGTQVELTGLVIQNGQYVPGGSFGDGGGIQNKGNLTATGLLIQNNTGRERGNGAGGLVNWEGGTAYISHSAIISNYSAEGAGGVMNIGEMTLNNVTISGNDAYGIFNAIGHLQISYSTISNNVSEEIWIAADPGTVVIGNSIISGFPESGSCFGARASSFTSNGFNIEYNSSSVVAGERACIFDQPSDLVDVDPMLLPLSAYDGAALPIHALDPASPAIDSADPANCSGTDQNGVARPQGSGCDRGAYESHEIISLPDLPVATAPPEFEVPELIPFILVIQVPANCRQGPGTAYPVVNSAEQGEEVEVLGKNVEGTWWYSKVDNDKCFISNVAGTPSGDLNLLTVIQAPPTPIPTATEVIKEEEEEQPTQATEIDFDKDGYGVSVDCNDKNGAIHPNAAETPDDKVDSNCNGDDDT
jgi:hypothetical protein